MSPAPPVLRIAHVTGERGFSGGEVQVFLLLEGLRARGHACALLCPPESRSAAEARRRGFDTYGVPMRSPLSPLGAWRVARALRRARPDVVHLHTGRANWLGAVAARALGLPAVSTRRMDRRVARGLRTRWLYAHGTRRVAAISPAVRDRLLAAGVAPARVVLIPSAVDPAALRPERGRETTREALSAPEDACCLLALAALVPRKGLDVLLDAYARLADVPPTRLWIAGEGPERAALERQARALGLDGRVRFLGQREDKADLLAACDVLVLPSRHEGLGIAALEAMACGRAVVASRVGGLADALDGSGAALLVPSDDASALAGALSRLVADPALRRKLAQAGPPQVARRFLPEPMTAAYEALYRDVLRECAR